MRGQSSRGPASPARSNEFDQFVAQSLPPLTRTALVITWNLADAEDVVQEALYRIARHWNRVRAMASPYAYARRVVIHRALRGADKRATHRQELFGWPEGVVADLPARGGDDVETVELRLDLAQMLGQLAPRQRAVIVLRFAEQLTEAEVAEVLGWPLGTVKSTAARALERLRTDLGGLTATPATGSVRPAPDPSSASLRMSPVSPRSRS
ncbi:MAG: SigE family RNA polymerase sigma factor [Actinomycetota bacterium]|nr:SigE family RNA polymerase sigma factor [Actinomycetota bacterium]